MRLTGSEGLSLIKNSVIELNIGFSFLFKYSSDDNFLDILNEYVINIVNNITYFFNYVKSTYINCLSRVYAYE